MKSEHVTLTDKHAAFIRANVETGTFQDASEVVRAGLRLLEEQQAELRARQAKLCALLDAAEAEGLSPRTPEQVWEEVEAR